MAGFKAVPLPASQPWEQVAYGNKVFVAVGGSDTAAVSKDGLKWKAVTMPAMGGWGSIAFGNGVFVAIPKTSDPPIRMVCAVSADGTNWEWSNRLWYEIAYSKVVFGNGRFVAVDQGGRAQTSFDGRSWTETFIPYPDPMFYMGWTGLAAGNNRFVATADVTPMVASSSDGANWQQNHLGIWAGVDWVTFGNGKFVAILHDTFLGESARHVMSSPDGITWTLMTGDAPWKDDYFYGAEWGGFGGGLFYAFVPASPARPDQPPGVRAYSSPDGAVWTLVDLPAAGYWSSVGGTDDTVILLPETPNDTALVLGGESGVGPYLRMGQRDDGLGVVRHPRLAGPGSNGPSSAQLSRAPRLGSSNRYQ